MAYINELVQQEIKYYNANIELTIKYKRWNEAQHHLKNMRKYLYSQQGKIPDKEYIRHLNIYGELQATYNNEKCD